jgi:hypothetical protein
LLSEVRGSSLAQDGLLWIRRAAMKLEGKEGKNGEKRMRVAAFARKS